MSKSTRLISSGE